LPLLLGAMVAALMGCAEVPEKKDFSNLVWPPAPEQPRIRFLAEYRGQSDFGRDSLKTSLLGVESTGWVLQKPYGVTASKDGNQIYVTDTKLHTILVFDLKERLVKPMPLDARGGLRNPLEIRVDSKGRFYVTDSERNELLVYSAEGKTLMALGKKEEIGRPTGLALDEARNRIYVADTTRHRIVVYDFEGKFIGAFGERGSDPGQFNYPVNLSVDKDGNLLVVDSANFRVQLLSPEGRFISAFGRLGDAMGTFSRPKGIALDSDGNVYVADAAFNNFQIFNREGKILLFVGQLGRDPGMFWLPAGMYMDEADRLYVADSVNGRVQVFQYLKEERR
jgi:DNA-binding beta-propeller fold protein YncE